MDEDLDGLLGISHKLISRPHLSANRITEQGIFAVEHQGNGVPCVIRLAKREIDMVRVERHRHIVPVIDAQVLPLVALIQAASQGHVALGSGNMLSLHVGLPRPVGDAVLTPEIHIDVQGRERLHAIRVIEPHQGNGQQHQQQDPGYEPM